MIFQENIRNLQRWLAQNAHPFCDQLITPVRRDMRCISIWTHDRNDRNVKFENSFSYHTLKKKTYMGREQEIVMFPALMVVCFAVTCIRDARIRSVLTFIVACQVCTHIRMIIKPFKCNPNSGKVCNKFALCAGLIFFFALSKVIALDKQRNPCILFANIVAIYSIVSHIVHIDMSEMIRRYLK